MECPAWTCATRAISPRSQKSGILDGRCEIPCFSTAPESADPSKPSSGKPGIRLLSSVAFFRGNAKAYETPVVESQQLNAPERRAAVFQLEVPLTSLKPGFYTCQVNVIDDAAGQFRFPRLAMLVRQPN